MIKSSVLWRHILGGSALFALGACSVDQPPQAKASCPAIDGVDTLLSAALPTVIVLGEVHGMSGPPEFTKALICHAQSRNLNVALGLEMSDDEDRRFDTFMKSSGDDAAMEAFMQHGMWQSHMSDGRSSEAVLDLINHARQIEQDDMSFKTFFFTDTDADYKNNPDSAAGQYEKGMADNILTQARSGDFDKVIVLVGNLHAKRGRNTFGVSNYEYMANHMKAPETMALNNVYSRGTSWNCTANDTGGIECGASKTGGYVRPESELIKTGNFAVMTRHSETENLRFVQSAAFGYDGVFYIGPAKASPPANMEGRKPE